MRASHGQCCVLAIERLQASSSGAPYISAPFSLPGSLRKNKVCPRSLLSRRKPFLRGSILIQGAHGVGRDRQRVDRRTQPVQAISGWPDTALEKAIDVLQHVYSLVKLAIRWAQSQRHLLEKWYVKAAASILLVLGLITAAANVWCLGPINQRYIPQAVIQAEVALERKVKLGRVRWVAPSGLVGFGPLASVGPVSLGPGAAEKSSLEIPRVVVCVDPLQSLLQRKLILHLLADQAQVSLVQADNFAWFGYPDDPEPSARNFLPGLAKGLETDIAQHLLPDGDSAMGSGQPLGGLAARLSSKVARAEARQDLPPAPESALNFRPAVGSELELVSRDERELAQSRAELAALLTQQRSVQAATVQSQASTSDAQDSMQERAPVVKRQSSKHRSSSPSSEQAQQAQQAQRTEATARSHRERGHVSQPKASTLRVQSARPPFASISAGASPSANRPSDSAAKASMSSAADTDNAQEQAGRPESASAQREEADQSLELPQGQQEPARPVELPRLRGLMQGLQRPDSSSALQPLTADKSVGEQERKEELAERLGLIRPRDSIGSLSRLSPQRPEPRSKSGPATPSTVTAAQDNGESTENAQVLGKGEIGQGRQARAQAKAKKRRAVQLPQVLEVSGAEAREESAGHLGSSSSGQVRWGRPTADGGRSLHVSTDGPKDAIRPSEGLKAQSDEARAEEIRQAQKEDAGAATALEGTSEGADPSSARHDTASMSAAAYEADSAEAVSDIQSSEAAAEGSESSRGGDTGRGATEQAPPAAQTQAEGSQHDNQGLLDALVSRLRLAQGSRSSRTPEPQSHTGPEASSVTPGDARGAQRWRPRAPARRTARSMLRESRPTMQGLESSALAEEGEQASADTPAESTATGIEEIQSKTQDTEEQAASNGDEGGLAQGSQAAAAAEGQPALADDDHVEEDSRAQGLADAQGKTGADAAGDATGIDRQPGWAMQLHQQLHNRAVQYRADAEELFSDLWERRGWKCGPVRQPAAPAEALRTAGETQDHQPAVASEAAARESSAGSNEGPQGSEGEVPAATLRFSLHRSHAQLYVSSAETAAACGSVDAAAVDALFTSAQQKRLRRKVRFVPGTALTEQQLTQQPVQTHLPRPPQAAPSWQEQSEKQVNASAVVEAHELPSTEEDEDRQPAESSLEDSTVVSTEGIFSTREGAAVADRQPEAPSEEVRDPASFELTSISGTLFPEPRRGHRQGAAQAPEAAAAAAEGPEQAQEAAAAQQRAAATEAEDSKPPHQADEDAVASKAVPPEEATAAGLEERGPEQAAEPKELLTEQQQPVPEPSVLAETRETAPGEVEAEQPAVAEPKAEPSTTAEAGRSKPKHSWHSPALSARYGELPPDEPRYKPRLPDADQGGLRAWAAKHISGTLANIQAPQLALEHVVIRKGDLWATVTGEAIPRHVQNIDLKLKLGRDYRTLTLDITGMAHERDSASDKCTMMNAIAQRHLRDAPSAPIVHSFSEVPRVAAPERSSSAQPGAAASLSLGRDRVEWEQQLQRVAQEASEGSLPSPLASYSSSYGDSGDLDDPIQVAVAEQQKAESKGGWFSRARKDRPKPARPTGGRIRVQVKAKELGVKDQLADLELIIWGDNLHAPLVERIVELPMDIYGGRLNGRLRLLSNDADSWRFPVIRGRIRGHDLGFHFFDAPDDFSRTKLDLMFEGDRLYLHNTQGYFGAVPMSFTGDMDLNPETGQYRLSASVPGVEANDLRKTLAIRPLPFPVGGAVRGVLHCTGPLETPVFSGTAVAMPPAAADVEGMEDSNAKETLQEFPQAVGAYDRMPFASAAAVWTLDTSTDIFLLHSLQAEPLSGGQLLGSGRMWVSPSGEVDPRAVKVRLEGRNLPTETLLKRYLPKGAPMPPMELGDATVAGVMEGSFLSPDMRLSWEAPAAAASGSVDLSRDSNSFTCRAPAVDVSASLLLKPAPFDAVKTVLTQAEATALAQPQIEGADIDCNFKGLDVLPLANALERGAAAKAQRLKLNGRTKVSVRLTPMQGPAPDGQAAERPSAFSGDLTLDGLRVNQLKLSRNLTGSILLSNEQFQIRAKGLKPDEVLEVNLKLPSAPGESSEAMESNGKDSSASASRQSVSGQAQGAGGALLGKQRPGLGGLGTLLPRPRFAGPASPLLAPLNPTAPGTDAQSGSTASDGGHFVLRCGNLLMSAEVNGRASQVECAVQGLLLDELELASLRGEVQEALLSLNLEQRLGRAVVAVAGPRFSGLQGRSLSGAFRWERDVVRLERAVLQQANSRYEVQGEYVIPSVAALPKSAAELALMQMGSGQGAGPSVASPFEQADGRWRVQVSVPTANMEEIIPAARLLSRATALTPSDYERAKSAFLSGMDASSLAAQEIGQQLEAAALATRMAMEADTNTGMEDSAAPGATAQQAPSKAAEKESKQSSSRSALSGLQDLKGQWSGSAQAYGGGGGATNVDFNVRGQSWQWGDYALDQVVANGSCHSIEGIKLEELGLKTGEAKLLVRGNLLGAAQDASIILTDFPVAILQPVFRALPALEHAAPAVAASGAPGGSGGGGTLGGLAMPFVRGAHLRSHAARPYTFANSPVNGLLYVRGTIGGSATVPEGEVSVRLYDGAIGPTYLAQAQAQASLSAAQQLAFSADLAPAEAGRHSGHVRVSGSIPLRAPLPAPAGPLLAEAGGGAGDGATAPSAEQLEVDVSVKDGGMMLVTALTPDLRWQSGAAELTLAVRGAKSQPQIEGSAQFSKAAMLCPWLKYPITNLGGAVRLENGALMIEGLEAHVGRRGRIRIKGGLPLTADSSPAADAVLLPTAASVDADAKAAGKEPARAGLLVDVHGLEMRVRNVYTGYLDAGLKLLNSLTAPSIGGDVRISRGVASLMPGGPSAPGGSGGSGGSGQLGTEIGEVRARARENDLVLKAFTVLTRKDALARQLSRLDVQQAGEASLQPMAQALCLNGLKIHLGPELRAMFPVVLNMGISGDIELNGLASPESLKVAGTIHLDGGEVNLVATQLVLDREHPNRMVFSPARGLDPLVDLRLRGAQVQALIQGRASLWQQNLILTPTKGGAGDPRGATEAAEAARIFEGQLAGALVAEDGQLALSNLAASAAHGFMPKIQTQGQLGQARWRLVSAPSIPGLLSLDPSGDPTSLLSSLTMGTEVEVQFGRSLQAAMARKLRDSDIATQWTLNYQLNSKLRMQFNIASSSPYPRTLVFQYSSETTPPPLPR